MTLQEKRDYFGSYISLKKQCDLLLKERRKIMASKRALSKHNTSKLDEIEQTLTQHIGQLNAALKDIMAKIESLEDPKLRAVLVSRYILDQTLYEASVSLRYEIRWICRLSDKALNLIDI